MLHCNLCEKILNLPQTLIKIKHMKAILSGRGRFPVAPCVCGADALSTVKGTPDV